MGGEDFGGGLPVAPLSGAAVEPVRYVGEVIVGVDTEVGARREYWRKRPLVFSLNPRCRGLPASAKKTPSDNRWAISSWRAISDPWSQVGVLRIWLGMEPSAASSASRTASESWPLRNASSTRYRLWRSTRVPIVDRLPRPTMRSPSQSPTRRPAANTPVMVWHEDPQTHRGAVRVDQDRRRRPQAPIHRPATQRARFKITTAVYNLIRITALDAQSV